MTHLQAHIMTTFMEIFGTLLLRSDRGTGTHKCIIRGWYGRSHVCVLLLVLASLLTCSCEHIPKNLSNKSGQSRIILIFSNSI